MQVESLLSCYGDEIGMMEDEWVALNDLRKVKLKLAPVSSRDVYEFIKGDLVNCLKLRSLVDRNSDAIFMHESSIEFTMVPVWFTMGINENATIAEKFFSTSFQEEINKENYSRLNDYFKKYSALPENVNSGNVRSIDGMMQLLQTNIFSTKKNKNVDIIQIAGDICRALNGARFTSCKSAKDRTSMSVTLEQVKLLRREHDLAQDAFIHALDSIRSEGVRRDNTLKNTGVRKYAFNTIQIVSLPKMYRPPKGTFGNTKN
ncbi:hypothetical protein HELRODRAFT_85686 [Helobdella robusta]|uniref:Uncharacterized protein n=1 Tax=Helobdella robusta TaxID=6412 RepID=T1G617_HELRO|nr:hypothetical protein HELRODRAFT_85686 [Helobdella robusta]ESN97221.1 hypothetical protein HELRODRAFT_85686 [Helobdella robusta]